MRRMADAATDREAYAEEVQRLVSLITLASRPCCRSKGLARFITGTLANFRLAERELLPS